MLKKMKKYLKFLVCCALMLSLMAPSYAALSASDGSAFVTKAEFDSALADFNARLTTFEAGINSKIDSQVTSYLDRNGIWSGKAVDEACRTYQLGYVVTAHAGPYGHSSVTPIYGTRSGGNGIGMSYYVGHTGFYHFSTKYNPCTDILVAKMPKSGLAFVNWDMVFTFANPSESIVLTPVSTKMTTGSGLPDILGQRLEYTVIVGFQVNGETRSTANLGWQNLNETSVYALRPSITQQVCLFFVSANENLYIKDMTRFVSDQIAWGSSYWSSRSDTYTAEKKLETSTFVINDFKIY